MGAKKSVLVTDLDNTTWDWFEAWFRSFSAMLEKLSNDSGVPRSQLEAEIRPIHQLRGTTEYSNLLNEIPSLRAAVLPREPAEVFDEALHALHSERRRATRLYPRVLETLNRLKSEGVTVIAYTESVAYWTEWRIKHTGLDGVIDILYSAPDHDLPRGVGVESLRQRDPSSYGLRQTEHRHVGKGEWKPNPEILRAILRDCGKAAEDAVYIGDSLIKDVSMAQSVGVLDAHAEYGQVQHRDEYNLLRRVSHWTDADVERERALPSGVIVPTVSCTSFERVLDLF